MQVYCVLDRLQKHDMVVCNISAPCSGPDRVCFTRVPWGDVQEPIMFVALAVLSIVKSGKGRGDVSRVAAFQLFVLSTLLVPELLHQALSGEHLLLH